MSLEISPQIVYEHDDWVLLDKPEGCSVEDLTTQFTAVFPHFHPVHRLDKETSGLWLVAKHGDANRLLSYMFSDQKIQKTYIAITHKSPKKKQGKIVGDMARSRRRQWQLLNTKENPAIMTFRSEGISSLPGKRLVVCKPLTGKTHQIRVAMKSIGSPIWGDAIYDAGAALQADRMYLHAYGLRFEWHGQSFQFQSEPRSGEIFLTSLFKQQLYDSISSV